jgi:hypothetical protein
MNRFVVSITLSAALLGLTATSSLAEVIDGKDGLKFERQMLTLDANECCDVADVNGDGKLDAIVGRSWYAAPDFVSRPLRTIADWNKYVENNGEHALDVNGDGHVDVISGSFLGTEVYWYENPGPDALKLGLMWPQHLLVDTGAKQNEGNYMHDVDGDGVSEFMVDSWNAKNEQLIWKLAKDADGKPTMTKHVVGPVNGHGFAFGDVNNDGRNDLLLGTGWYECPEGDPLSKTWTLHNDWELKHYCCPALVVDVDDDGVNDMIWSHGHEYGLFWWQQQKPAADGKLQFKEYLIDDTWSQPHCLVWVDLDGDGAKELLTGKRILAHNGGDPGSAEPPVLYYYKWDSKKKSFVRYLIDKGHAGGGIQIRTGDLNSDGRLDILVAGKSGTYILFNQGCP